MSTFLSIVKSTDGSIALNVDTSLFSSPSTKVEPTPKAIPAQVAPTKPAKAVATKPSRPASTPATKVARAKKPSAKGDYRSIRSLTQAGRYDEAIALAQSKDWGHVVVSILSHQAKRANAPTVAEPVKPIQAKVAKKAAPPVNKPKAQPAKAQGAKAPATKKAAAKAVKAAAKPVANKAQVFPKGNVSEADLVLWWAAAMAEGHLDIVQGAKQATAESFKAAMAAGDKGATSIQMKRLRNLDNLLKQAV